MLDGVAEALQPGERGIFDDGFGECAHNAALFERLEPATDNARHQLPAFLKKRLVGHLVPPLRHRVMLVHPCPLLGGETGLYLRYVFRWRCVTDVDILRPLQRREIRQLIYLFQVIDPLALQPSAWEKVMPF